MIGIYARQSIERQDSVSIEAQVAQCVKNAGEPYEVYQDIGYSGKNTKRPEFERLIQDIKSRRIRTVISYRLDRISRSLSDFAKLLEFFDQYDVQYISATEQFDTSSPIGRAMIYIVMVFAQLERETIALRIEDNYKYRARQGLYMGGNTPYGYTSQKIDHNGKKISILKVNTSQADTLMQIFRLFLAGHRPNEIADILNQQGMLNRSNKPWTSLNINRVLRNIAPCTADQEIYEHLMAQGYIITNPIDHFDGKYGMTISLKTKNKNEASKVHEQVVAIGKHQPILSSKDFIKAQFLLNNMSVPIIKRSESSFLSGLVICNECESSMTLKTTKYKSKTYRYLRCSGKEARNCANTKHISADLLEEQVTQALNTYIRNLKIDIVEQPSNEQSGSSTDLSMQIRALLDFIGKVDKPTDEMIMTKIKSLKTQQKQFHKYQIPNKQRDSMLQTEYITKLFDEFQRLDIFGKTAVIRAAISQIRASPNGIIEIIFHF